MSLITLIGSRDFINTTVTMSKENIAPRMQFINAISGFFSCYRNNHVPYAEREIVIIVFVKQM